MIRAVTGAGTIVAALVAVDSTGPGPCSILPWPTIQPKEIADPVALLQSLQPRTP